MLRIRAISNRAYLTLDQSFSIPSPMIWSARIGARESGRSDKHEAGERSKGTTEGQGQGQGHEAWAQSCQAKADGCDGKSDTSVQGRDSRP